VLTLNNLGEKRIEFPRDGNGAQVHEAIISTFPSLASGYQLLRNSEGRGKELLKIPMPASGFSIDYLKSVLGQANGFLRPLQKDIVLVGESASTSSNFERSEGEESTHLETNSGPMVACINCSGNFAMTAISDHHLVCNGGGSGTAGKEKRTEGIEQYCRPSLTVPTDVNSNQEDPLDNLKQLLPDTDTKDLEQALESCGGDTNQAAEFLLQGNETGNIVDKQVEHLMVWADDFTPSDNITDMDDLSDIIARLAKQLTGPVIRVTVDENRVILDALPIYKSAKLDPVSPVTVQFQNQPAVNVGGPKREFYTRLFNEIAKADGGLNLVLFEGPDGPLMPKYSATIVYSGILTVVGKMIAHSIVQCGIGFPFLSPAAYWYIVTGGIAKAVGYCNLSDVRDIEVAHLIKKLMDSDKAGMQELGNNASFISLLCDAGCSERPTVKNKQLLVESLMLHTVLSKKKVVLDHVRKGLQILNVLDEITKRPRLFENLFLSNPNVCDVTAEKVVSSLSFSINESCATRDHLLQYMNECSKQDLQHFLRFITGSCMLPQGACRIDVLFTDDDEGCVFASTCLLQLHVPQHFESYEGFKAAMKAVSDPSGQAFNSI